MNLPSYIPNELQRDFHTDQHRFRVLACGRRWGKTLCGMVEAYRMLDKAAKKHQRKARVWVVDPTFNLVQEDWRAAEEWFGPHILRKRLTDMALEFSQGDIEFKSADAGDERLRGA